MDSVLNKYLKRKKPNRKKIFADSQSSPKRHCGDLKAEQRCQSPPPAYLTSWWFTWAGGGGTKEPDMNQGLPVAGKEVGLMYSFSSQSDDGFSAPDAAARDLSRRETK